MSSRVLFVLMQELPLEATGGGLLLRELLRHLVSGWLVTAVIPSYPHQRKSLDVLLSELARESVNALALPVSPDWGTFGFTIRRQLSGAPGTICALRHRAALEQVRGAALNLRPSRWLMVSPFAAAYLPGEVPAEYVRLYYTNVDENIVGTRGRSFWQRLESSRERRKVRGYVARIGGRAARSAAISEAAAGDLSRMTSSFVDHVPPLLAPRPVARGKAVRGLVLITTNYTYWHNRVSLEWFFRSVWPLVPENVHLEVTGLDTSDGALAALCARERRVSYLGFLPRAGLDDCFERCSVAVNPTISGSGFQIKILDALARGVPLASTRFGNPLAHAIPSADQPADLARNIHTLACDETEVRFDYNEFHAGASRRWTEFLN